MGDFNDNPTDNSFKKILRTKGERENLDMVDLYNLMEKLFKIGFGSLTYRGRWSLFDQFYMTSNLVRDNKKYRFSKTGKYKGVCRSFSGISVLGQGS